MYILDVCIMNTFPNFLECIDMIIKGQMLSLDVDGRFNMTALDDDIDLQCYVAAMVCPQRPILTNEEMLASIQQSITELQCFMDDPEIYTEQGNRCSALDDQTVQEFLALKGHTSMYVDVDDENTYWVKCTLPELKFSTIKTGGRLNEDQMVAIMREFCSDVSHVSKGVYVATLMDKTIDVVFVGDGSHNVGTRLDMKLRNVSHGHYNIHDCHFMEIMLRTELAAIAELT